MTAVPELDWRWLPPGPEAWAIWSALECDCAPVGATASLPWVRAWSQTYADLVEHRIGLATHDGVPLGAVIVGDGVRRRGGLPMRSVHLGTSGEPSPHGVEAPYGRMLVADEDRSTFARALVAALERDRRWDVLRIERLHPLDASALLEAAQHWRGVAESSPSIELVATSPEQRLEVFPSRTRRQIRRAIREHGPFSVEVARDVAEGHDVLDDLIRLHEARFQPGAFADPRFVGFHRLLIEDLLPDGRLLLIRVSGETGPLGCVAVVRDGPRALSYSGGIAAARGPHDKPGFLVHLAATEVCAAHGMEEYDLLTGTSPYKHELARTLRAQWTLTNERRRPRVVAGSAGRGLRRARRAVPLPSSLTRSRG